MEEQEQECEIPFVWAFFLGPHFTHEVRLQVFEVLKSYMPPDKETWVFHFYEGWYVVRKASWSSSYFTAPSLPELLDMIVHFYQD